MATAAQTAAWGRLLAGQGIADPRATAGPPRRAPPKPDPWPNARDPRLPKPPPGTPALRDVPGLFGQNFGPDIHRMVSDAVTGLTHADLQAGRFLASPNLPWWYKAAAPAMQAVQPSAGAPLGTPMQRQAHQVATGLVNDWISKPGEPLGSQAKRTLAYHPAQATADAALAFAPEEGYASALRDAAAIPGAGGTAVRTALRAANTARKVVNPLEGVPYVAGRTVRGVQQAARSAGLVDGKTGLLTPLGLAQVKKLGATATPGLQDADYADPRVQRQFASAIQSKGLTPETLKEAVLNYNGAPTPRGPITGVEPPGGAAAGQTTKLINQGRQALNDRVNSVVGPPAPSTPTVDAMKTTAPVNDALFGAVDPTTGIRTPPHTAGDFYNGWRGVLDPEDQAALRSHVIQTQMPAGPGGVRTASQVRDFANSSLGGAALAPGEGADLRMAAEGHDVLDSEMYPTGSGDPANKMFWGLARPVLAGVASYGASQFLPADLMSHIPGGEWAVAGAGSLAEKGIEKLQSGQRAAQVGQGAPAQARGLDVLARPAEAAAATAGAAPYASAALAQPPKPPPPPPQLTEPEGPAIDFGTNPKLEAPPPGAVGLPSPKKGEVDPWPNAPDPRKSEPGAEPEKPGTAPADDDAPIDFSVNPKMDAPAPQAAGGRVSFAEGGQVVSMVDRLMQRAEREGKATRSATKPLLGLDDNTVAKALAIANRAI